jgi:RimJ/RimL family protein N-acetyltransferase
MEPVSLQTARVELSAPTPADTGAIFSACQDPEVQRWTTVPSPYTRTHAEEFVALTGQWWADDAEYAWAIRAETGFSGMISLRRTQAGEAEIGYWLGASARGRGLLAEAGAAVLDWGFDPEGGALERIMWRAMAGNVASARTARALGFRYEGLLRRGLRMESGGVDGWIAGLLSTDDRVPHPWPVLAD